MAGSFIRFEWDGSYNRTHEFLQRLPRSYERERARAMRNFGINTLVDLQTRIQDGNTSPALSPEYKTWKAENGFDTGTLVKTRSYYRNIRIEFTDTGFSIIPDGVEPNVAHMFGFRKKSEPRTYEDIALWLEYGTKTMPARPHWRPTSYRARGKFPHIMGKTVQAAFDRARQGSFGGKASGFTFDVRKPLSEDSEE
jgi:hypothetical protein